VNPGGSIYLTVYYSGLYDPSCSVAGVSLTIAAQPSGPAVSLTSPSPGALITGGQPTFSGTADTSFGSSGQITVDVYSGSGTGGSPLQSLTTSASGGNFSVGPSSPLADGVYTAVATQTDGASPPDVGTSPPDTFRVFDGTPTLTLNGPGTTPIENSAPTFTGTAGTAANDQPTATVAIYPGPDTTSSPVRFVGGQVASNGTFEIQITPGLSDGQYTAVAIQLTTDSSPVGFSGPVQFAIKVNGPAVTITTPASGSNLPQSALTFAGAAGNIYGDSPSVDVALYAGPDVTGRLLGTQEVSRSGASWSAAWANQLALGIYTLRVQQHDVLGHVTTALSTFIVVPPSNVIGTAVQISEGGVVTAPISCLASGGTCSGYVLILSHGTFSPVHGGPSGKLRVMFAYFRINAGETMVVARHLSSIALKAMRANVQRVDVTALLTVGSGKPQRPGGRRALG
jgi:hypothetical protein